jgi:thioredoxin-like negative regulator of GroEL
MVGPIIDELSNEYEGKVVIGKVDVDANQELLLNTVLEISQQFFFIMVK